MFILIEPANRMWYWILQPSFNFLHYLKTTKPEQPMHRKIFF